MRRPTSRPASLAFSGRSRRAVPAPSLRLCAPLYRARVSRRRIYLSAPKWWNAIGCLMSTSCSACQSAPCSEVLRPCSRMRRGHQQRWGEARRSPQGRSFTRAGCPNAVLFAGNVPPDICARLDFNCAPRETIAIVRPTAIPAAIRLYSIEVPPESSSPKRSACMVFLL